MEEYCVYCKSKDILTREHVPAKLFLEKPYPKNLNTVWACKRCNSSFSMHEEYLLNVLAEISNAPNLTRKKATGGPIFRARERRPLLKKRIQDSLVSLESGLVYFKPEYNRVRLILEKTAMGIYINVYKKPAKLEWFRFLGFFPFSVFETRPPEVILSAFTEKFLPKKWKVVQKEVFSYIVVRDQMRGNKLIMIMNFHNSVWGLVSIPYPSRSRKREDLSR